MTTDEIKRSTPADVAALTSIALASKKYWGYSDEQIEKWKADLTVTEQEIEENFVFHIERNGRIVGFYVLSERGDTFEIEHMWVLPEHIGTGLGRALFNHAKKMAVQTGGKKLKITSDPNAEGFYLKMGLKRTGETRSSIPGRALPVLEMGLNGVVG